MGKILIYLLYASLVYFLAYTNVIPDNSVRFYSLTVLLVLYNAAELVWLKKTTPKHFFINPILLAVIANFLAYQGGASNFLLLQDGKYVVDAQALVLYDEHVWLDKTMAYTCWAAMAMWIGYKFDFGKKLANIPIQAFGLKHFLGSELRFGFIIILAILGYGIKVYLMQLGLYGRLGDGSASTLSGSFVHSQLRFLKAFSTIPFLLITLLYFKNGGSKMKVLFIVVFCLEFFFGFITGARGPIVILSIIVALAYYYNKQKLNSLIIVYGVLSFYLAFTVAFQFKHYAQERQVTGLNPIELIKGFNEYRETISDKRNARYKDLIMMSFATRVNFTDEAAMAIRYKEVEGLSEDDPDFLRPLYMIPVDILIPKFIQGTPNPSWGYWFKVSVLKTSPKAVSNTAFSSVGYLYLAGGLFFILLGFFTYGILLKASYQFLNYGLIGFIIYMVLLSSLVIFKTGVATVYVGFFRAIIVMPILIGLIFKRIPLK